MIKIKRYWKVETLEEAYELNQKRANRIIGGMVWMKMGEKQFHTAIDLSDVVSSEIVENEEEFIIGAMTTLRDLECHEGIHKYTDGAVKESLRHIVGVQFRNVATVGGSIWGRFGFSDVLTMFLAMDTYVDLYKGGRVSLEAFSKMPYDKDILLNIVVKKNTMSLAYESMRNTKTDFPVLACAASVRPDEVLLSIGARPQKAVIIRANDTVMKIDRSEQEEFARALAVQVKAEISVGSNMRASAEYRRQLAGVLARRAVMKALVADEQKPMVITDTDTLQTKGGEQIC
ncbi:MAG: FAD binding domain-containing protein [Lachnospiraceae bacterium]|nr:FAD binding domain-containing protein [Lachnospiraceae bacterium]MDD3614693.1 FAD binding domain-containing protein [Lachnospiraceae bacterium]